MEGVLGRRAIQYFAWTRSRHLGRLFQAVVVTPSAFLHPHNHLSLSVGHTGCLPGAKLYSIQIPSFSRQGKILSSVNFVQCHFHETRTQIARFKSSSSSPDREVVYTAPLKGAVRAIKIFSLTTAVLAFFGGPVLVWCGNPSVPLVGRAMMSSLVMVVGLGTTAILHWLVKGEVL